MNRAEFDRWIGQSRVVGEDGLPLVVFRGEHGPVAGSGQAGRHTRRGSLSFGSASTASVYAVNPNDLREDEIAQSPRVIPAYLRIENPLLDSPDDPFLDLALLRAALGEEQARRIALKFSSHIENTGHWQDEIAPQHPSVRDYITQASADDLDALYFNAYPFLDDPSEVQLLQAAGFDGAIYGGSGENAMEPEYRVFSDAQVLAAVEAGWPVRDGSRELPVKPVASIPAPRSTVKKVRAALTRLVGESAVRLGEGLGRLVVTTSKEIRADGYFQMSPSVLASFAERDFFEEMLAEQRAATARAIEEIGDVGDCAIVRKASGAPRWQMILRDASEPGKWRTQSFDLKGFSGHMVYPDRDAAIHAAASDDFTVRDDMALDRIQDSPEFQRGLYVTDLIGRVNARALTHHEADRLLAEYDECHRVLQSIAASGAQAFVANGGEVMYLLADRIYEGTEGAVFLHEIVHRYGRRILGETGFADLVMRLKDWSSRPQESIERIIHDAASARARAASGKSPSLYDEELFAYSVEEAVSRGVQPRAGAHPESAQAWLDQVTATLRGVIRASMGGDIDLGDAQDLVDLAYAFAQLESPERTERILQALSPGERTELSALIGREGLPNWYSALAMRVRLQGQAKMPPRQWIGWINAQVDSGIKPDEIYWSGVTGWLSTLPGDQVVDRSSVLEFIEANGVHVAEVEMKEFEADAGDGERRQAEQRASRLLVELTAAGYAPETESYTRNQDRDLGYKLIGLMRRADQRVFYFDEGVFCHFEDGQEREYLSPEVTRMGVSYKEALDQRDLALEKLGEPKYVDWTLDGGKNYREVLLTLPPSARKPRFDVISRADKSILYRADSAEAAQAWIDKNRGMPAARGAEVMERDGGQPAGPEFRSTHWEQRNVLAHIRTTDRSNPDGQRVLFVEEIQSDWAQDGKRKGFASEDDWGIRDRGNGTFAVYQKSTGKSVEFRDGAVAFTTREAAEAAIKESDPSGAYGANSGVPSAPFVAKTDAWVGLALRRIIKLAADEGYDSVAFVTGEQSANRYNLRQRVDTLIYDAPKPHRAGSVAGRLDGDQVITRAIPDEADLVSFLGEDLARRLIEAPLDFYARHELTGLNETVGGRGMLAFYGQILPVAAKDVLRKFGGQLGEIEINRPAHKYTVGQDGAFVQRDGVERSCFLVYQEGEIHESFPTIDQANAYASKRNAEEGGTTWRQPGFVVTPALRRVARMGMPLFSFAAPEGVVLSAANDDEPPTEVRSPIESVFPPELSDWFGESQVTVDGVAAKRPLMVFRGAAVGDDDVGGVDPVSGRAMDVFWATSSRMNAAFYEDGEIQNLYLKLENPLVIRGLGDPIGVTVEKAFQAVQQGVAAWDGVIFEDVVDGAQPSVIYAVFPDRESASVADRIRIVGRTNYTDDGDPVFTGVQPPGDPIEFDRGDEIRHDLDWSRREQRAVARLAVMSWRADPRVIELRQVVDVDVYESRGKIQVDSLWVDPDRRGAGAASQLMRLLVEVADEHRVSLELEVGQDEAEIGLVDWYRRLGFAWDKGFMSRTPGAAVVEPQNRLAINRVQAERRAA